MADVVLLVFEGEKTELQIARSLNEHYFSSQPIVTSFNAEIYQLWRIIQNDKDLDLLEVIKERSLRNQSELADVSRDDVAQIFLFFDYDGHATNASDEAITAMLAHFNNETENGKLYISYPMVEALKHIPQIGCFNDVVVNAKIKAQEPFVNYKQLVASCAVYPDITNLKKEHWNHIIAENLKKSNVLVNDLPHLPAHQEINTLNQTAIFGKQLEKHIQPRQQIAVLSAFPFFIIEYFGEKALVNS
jgi:hypothetical protein